MQIKRSIWNYGDNLLHQATCGPQDHSWWWRSFVCGGSTGVFIYFYCFYYFYNRCGIALFEIEVFREPIVSH